MRSEYALQKAADYAARADDAFDDDTRSLFLRLRDCWIGIAERLAFTDDDDFPVAA